MSESGQGQERQSAAKARRKPEREAVLKPTFAVARAVAPGAAPPQSGRGLGPVSGLDETNSTATLNQTTRFNLSAVPNHSLINGAGQPLQANLMVNDPGDQYEQEADRVAQAVMSMSEPVPAASLESPGSPTPPAVSRMPEISRLQASGSQGAFAAPAHVESRLNRMQGSGQALPASEQSFFEARMGYDFADVRVHTDSNAIQASRDIQAQAFTFGNNIAFNAGKFQPASTSGRQLLAHELTHVVQQTGNVRRKFIQRAIAPTHDTTHGTFNVAVTTGGSNLPITIGYMPKETAPYSNQIGLIQIVKLTDTTGANIEPVSLPAARGGSLRTADDAASGVEGGFFTDVLHNDEPANPGAGTDAPPGQALPPQYPFGNGPAQPDTPTPGLSRPNSGAGRGAIVGYKRSNAPADIKAAELTDAPGYPTVNPANRDIDFEFETVAKGEDTMTVFGALKWSFGIRAGVVSGETASVDDSQSATFDAALSLHRDFYVHEPVIFYFDFDSRILSADEANKIDEFLDHLTRFPDVKCDVVGSADMRGGASDYNSQLSLDRATAVANGLRAKGVAESQISRVTVGVGATTDNTADATTNQDSEANRRGNRRVVLSFSRDAGGGGGAGGGTP